MIVSGMPPSVTFSHFTGIIFTDFCIDSWEFFYSFVIVKYRPLIEDLLWKNRVQSQRFDCENFKVSKRQITMWIKPFVELCLPV